jgi:DNA polymerase-1
MDEKRTLLIDGDILLYGESASVEVEMDWGDDWWTLHGDAREAKERVDIWIADIAALLDATDVVLTLTGDQNWRKDVLPTYKANRKGKRKPVVYKELKQYAIDTYKTVMYDNLEADDVMGILQTDPDNDHETVIVSEDKDMMTIPGMLYRPIRPEEGVVEISPKEADYNHFRQALMGDSTDGYAGCPGIGPKTAEKVLKQADPADCWGLIVGAYEKAGLTEEDALTQARVARILRHGEYCTKKEEVHLWNP